MNRKYLILHVIEGLGRGGAELRLLEDIRNLPEFDHRVCYLFKDRNELGTDFKKCGAQLHCLSINSNLGFLKGYFRLLCLIEKIRPDIIHTHLFSANIISRLACLFYPRITYIQTIHAPDYKQNGSFIYSRKRHIVELIMLLLKKPKFIAVSEYVKKESIKSLRLKEKDITVIYNYLNDSWFSCVTPQNENNPKRIITVSHLYKQKGLEYLVRAMRMVLDSGRDVLLSIVGDGPDRKSLLRLIKDLNLTQNIFLLGRRADVQKLIAENSIFVFPSVDEGLGIALIEAMSQEKICIAFNTGPIPEIIEDNSDGFLVQIRDSQALAQKIIYVIDNYHSCRDISKRARLKAIEKFSKDRSVSLLGNYYYNILRQS